MTKNELITQLLVDRAAAIRKEAKMEVELSMLRKKVAALSKELKEKEKVVYRK